MRPQIGEIRLFAFNFAPADWAKCEGQPMPIGEYDALFSRIGFTYGGDGANYFYLPNLTSKSPAPNLHYCIALFGNY